MWSLGATIYDILLGKQLISQKKLKENKNLNVCFSKKKDYYPKVKKSLFQFKFLNPFLNAVVPHVVRTTSLEDLSTKGRVKKNM